jgi:uncharacterized protein YkwD
MRISQTIALGVAALAVLGGPLRAEVDTWLVKDAEGCPHSSDFPKPAHIQATRMAILCLLNAERAKGGLPALRYSPALELASQRHSDDMATRKFFAHDTPDGVDSHRRMELAGYRGLLTGENIYAGTHATATPVKAVEGWMNSPGHRANILRAQFTEVGVGVAYTFPSQAVGARAAVYTTDFGG